eukprot:1188199-Prorocentrum_minimum.AAC.5
MGGATFPNSVIAQGRGIPPGGVTVPQTIRVLSRDSVVEFVVLSIIHTPIRHAATKYDGFASGA